MSGDQPRPGARSAPLKLYVEQILTGRLGRQDGPSGSRAAVKRAQVVVTYGRLAVASGPGCRRLPRPGVAWDGHVPEDRGQLVRKPEFGVYVTCRNPLLRAGRVRS